MLMPPMDALSCDMHCAVFCRESPVGIMLQVSSMLNRLCRLASHACSLQTPLRLDMTSCRIQYTSGEIEELDLDEIIREGHMSLITQ